MSWKDNLPKENIYFETENGILYCGDNTKILKQLSENIIDTVITDPPYGLRFMSKKWDYNVPTIEFWKELLRIVKPGATLLSFGGSRTQHRMTINIEDAGFVLKDTLMWLYGSGFPKTTDIAKNIDKQKGIKEWKETMLNPAWRKGNAKNATTSTGWAKPQRPPKPIVETPEAKLWSGYKSHGLKPAYEPIIMAMKSNEGSYADNVLKWGVAGLNIDAGRIGAEHQGRFPANILLDEEAAKMLDEQSGVSKSRRQRVSNKGSIWGSGNDKIEEREHNDKGGASRFFYVAKASKRERGEFNNHPTVKPLKLIEYLVKFTSMPNTEQVYLDPFAGSGTTLVACEKLKRRWIGIELSEEYCEIAKERILKVKGVLNV
jgi:DNA modification methylase